MASTEFPHSKKQAAAQVAKLKAAAAKKKRAMKTMENRNPKSLAALKKLREKKPTASKFETKIAAGKKAAKPKKKPY